MSNRFLSALGLQAADKAALAAFARKAEVPLQRIQFLDDTSTLPVGGELDRLCAAADVDPVLLMLRMGVIDSELLEAIRAHAPAVCAALGGTGYTPVRRTERPEPVFHTDHGVLYNADCVSVMRSLGDETIDLIFADPPFNLDKSYPSAINDRRPEQDYVGWSEEWLHECVRLLKPGGSLFVWNLPRWNTHYAKFLNPRLTFRHWIAVDIKYSLPISGRLYPSHYSLLYYCKGPKPKVFRPDRLPMQVCPECTADLKDYGGYKDKMNPSGVNLTDVWFDIPPVRHSKYKKRIGANELHIRLLDRVIELASLPGDLVLDPFGGSGTTYAVAEIKSRSWIGIEVGPVQSIIERLKSLGHERTYLQQIRGGYNSLFTEETLAARKRRGQWTVETVRNLFNGKHTLNDSVLGPYVPDDLQLQLRERKVQRSRKATG